MTTMLRRVVLDREPFTDRADRGGWAARGVWPAKWVSCPDAGDPPFVTAYRLRLNLKKPLQARIHVTADERYDLYVDGERRARGSERGDVQNWFYESYDLLLPAGRHVLVARVWSLGDRAPFAQMTLRPGFLLAGERPDAAAVLSTGTAKWEAKVLPGWGLRAPEDAWGTGWNLDLDGAVQDRAYARGGGAGWKPAAIGRVAANASGANEWAPGHLLRPALLPAQLDEPRTIGRVRFVEAPPSLDVRARPVDRANHLAAEARAWQDLLGGRGTVTIPPRSKRRVIVDLDDYYCARPELTTSGGKGALVRVGWEEALYQDPPRPKDWLRHRSKGNRDVIEGKYWIGVGDVFRPGGRKGETFDTLWWQAGRYVEIAVETKATALTLDRFGLRETRYPLEAESRFDADDPRLLRPVPIMRRVLQMCSHETYMDCPYYEQLMYVGDTRLEVLATYATTRDDRLPRKAILMFDESRISNGLTQSRYPSRVRQVIPPFSLWWVGMVHDFARWRGDRAFVQARMPGVRAVLDYFRGRLNAAGLVERPNGWNYMDWVTTWPDGSPPGGMLGVTGTINWQFALILDEAAEVEQWLGEREMAARHRKTAAAVSRAALKAFWDPRRGLFADDLARTKFSEHSQCLAILGGRLPAAVRKKAAAGLFTAPDLARSSIYFSHYLLETCRVTGRMDRFFARLQQWFDLPALGFKTTLEHPEPSRSDCHAWGAHPLYHYLATILGIRPKMGGREFTVSPQLGPLRRASGTFPLPQGDLTVGARREGSRTIVTIRAPRGVTARTA